MQRVPLFLLHAVLLPGSALPIKVFEARYLDMISGCLKDDRPFGICLIKSGSEVGEAGDPHTVGTLARIGQWEMPKPGVLMIEARGGERFSIQHVEKQGELLLADVELWPPEPQLEIPARYESLVTLLKDVYKEREQPDPQLFEDASWVSWQLAALLPVANETRQQWLETRDPVARLSQIRDALEQMIVERDEEQDSPEE